VRGRLLSVALMASFFLAANVAVAATSPQAHHHSKKHSGQHHGAKKHPQHSGAHKKNNKLHTGQ